MRPNGTLSISTTLANNTSEYPNTMNKHKMVENHIYTVELRLMGDLEPSEISARLNLQPSNSLSLFESQSLKTRRSPFWAYNGQGEVGFQTEWENLEDGLEFLLKKLSSRKAEVVYLSKQFDGVWWCGHFQSSFSGGPILSSKLLMELGSFGIPLSIDNYFSDDI